jgi:pilus assembly protein CpaB
LLLRSPAAASPSTPAKATSTGNSRPSARASPREPSRTIDVVVARHDLGKGDVISAQTMALRRVPEEFVSSSVVRPASSTVSTACGWHIH